MKRTTRSGFTITHAPLWRTTRHCQSEPYLLISTDRLSDQSMPLSEHEALELWHCQCFGGVEFTGQADDLIHIMRGTATY